MNMQEAIREFLQYLEIERGRSPKTIDNYGRYLNRFFDFSKAKKPSDVTEEQIREFRLYLNRQAGTKVGGRIEPMKRRTQNYYLIALRAFLNRWASHVPLAVELRNNSWNHQSVHELLRTHDVARVSNDIHDVPDLERHCYDTSRRCAYIRLIGRHDGIPKDHVQRPQTDALAWWADQIEALSRRDVRSVFVVVNNNYEGHAPQTLRSLGSELQARGMAVVPFSGFPDGQAKLF